MTFGVQTQTAWLNSLALASVAGLLVFCILPMVTFRIGDAMTFTGWGIYGNLILVPLVPVLLVLLAPHVDTLRPHVPLIAMVTGGVALLSLLRLVLTSTGFGRSFRQFDAIGANLPSNPYTAHWFSILIGAAALGCGIAIGLIGYQLRKTP